MGRLRDQLLREAEEDNRAAARELVGTPSRPDCLVGFAAAVADSGENLRRQQLDAAINELTANPHCIDRQQAERNFRATYAAVPSDQLDAIIRKAREA